MTTIKRTFILLIILTACSKEIPVDKFVIPDPKKTVILNSKIRSIHYTVDSISIDTNLYGTLSYKIGDTLFHEKYDSLGNLRQTVSYPAFRTATNYYYDNSNFLKYKTIQSDYRSEFYLANFMDTARRILYVKEVLPLDDTPFGKVYFNKKGLSDSSFMFTTLQKSQVHFKEFYTYRNDTLIMINRKTIQADLKEAQSVGQILVDTIKYEYANSRLKKISKIQLTSYRQYTEIENFNSEGNLYSKIYIQTGMYLRFKPKIKTPPNSK